MKKLINLFLQFFLITNLITGYALTNQQEFTQYSTIAMNIAVKGWANEAFMAAYGYDFGNYTEELLQASKYFTPEAWKNFKSTLDKSGTIQLIKNKQLLSAGLAEGTGPVILEQGAVNGQYTWKVRFPATITYQSSTGIFQVQHAIVNMTIIKTEGTEGIRGMAIKQLLVNVKP